MKNLDLHYFGSRDYIDVSTLSSALYKALPELTVQEKIRDFDIKLLKKVEYHCGVHVEEVAGKLLIDKDIKSKSSVIFNWKHDSKQYIAYFLETEKIITERVAELVEDPSDYMSYGNEVVTIHRPINNDGIYNLMKMGRMIVVNKYNLIPRVVRFHFDFIPGEKELTNVVMKAEPFVGDGFYRLNTLKDGKIFGEIIVKGSQDWKGLEEKSKR